MATVTGDFIREHREKRELSQQMVSDYMGFTNVFLARVELGLVSLPARHVDKLTRILNVEKEDLLNAMKKDLSERLDKRAK